jgi:hypothetical protein
LLDVKRLVLYFFLCVGAGNAFDVNNLFFHFDSIIAAGIGSFIM